MITTKLHIKNARVNYTHNQKKCMKAGWVIALGAGAFIAYDLYQQSQAAKLLTYKLGKVDFTNVTSGNTLLTVTVTITNPTSTNIMVNRVAGNLIINGTQVAVADTGFLLKSIKPGVTDITFPVVISNAALTAVIQQMLTNPMLDVKFNGSIYTPFITLPFTGVSISGPQRIASMHGIYGFSNY